MKDGNWIEQLRQMEAGHEMNVPDGLFDDIMKQMAQRKKRRTMTLLWSATGVAAAAIAALIIALPQLQQTTSVPTPQAQAKISKTQNSIETIDNTTSSNQHNSIVATISRHISAAKQIISGELPIDTTTQMATVTPQPVDNAPTDKQASKQPSTTEKKQPTKTLEMPGSYYEQNHSRKQHKLVASLFAQGMSLGASNSSDEALFSSADYLEDENSNNTQTSTPTTKSALQTRSQTEPSQQEASHDIPLRFGLTVALPLTDRLSIESGLVYTRLSSDISNTLGPDYASYKQTLHYIGIPLKLNYMLWSNRNVTVYAKGGAMIEKLVASNLEMQSDAVKPNRPKESSPQLSMSLAAGAALNIVKPLQIFIEPGVSHYFDNGSSICNIYKDRPTTFDLTFGVRIGL